LKGLLGLVGLKGLLGLVGLKGLLGLDIPNGLVGLVGLVDGLDIPNGLVGRGVGLDIPNGLVGGLDTPNGLVDGLDTPPKGRRCGRGLDMPPKGRRCGPGMPNGRLRMGCLDNRNGLTQALRVPLNTIPDGHVHRPLRGLRTRLEGHVELSIALQSHIYFFYSRHTVQGDHRFHAAHNILLKYSLQQRISTRIIGI